MRSLHLIAMGVAAVGLLVTVALMIALGIRRPKGPSPEQPDQGLEGLRFPEFALTDQNGTPQTHALLEGRYTVVDFVFTHCPLACPGMTGRMAEMQDTLAGTGVRFASFSLDPENDTPEKLREWAANFGADFSTWSLLTGDREAIWNIVSQGLRFELREDPSFEITLQDGTKMANIVHPVRFILVGPDRQVLGLYTFSDAQQMAMLENRVRDITRR